MRKLTFTQKKDGSKIALDLYSILYFYENLGAGGTVICYSLPGEIKEIPVFETYDEVMLLLYPKEEEKPSIPSIM